MSNQLWVKSYHTAISEIWTFKDQQAAEQAKVMLELAEDFEDSRPAEVLADVIVDVVIINSNLPAPNNYDIINPNDFVYFF